MYKQTLIDEHYRQLEKAHQASEREFLNRVKWLDVFPEAASTVYELIAINRKTIETQAQCFLEEKERLDAVKTDEFSYFFNLQLIKYRHIPSIINAKQNIRHLHKLLDEHNKAENVARPTSTEKVRTIPLLDVVSSFSDKVRVSYNRATLVCPLHEEKTPSFVVFLDTNHFHCFGCQAHGDAITFVEKKLNLSFKDASNWLERNFL